MTEVKTVGQTYQEYLREVRAIQFGRESEVISSITEGTTVKAVELRSLINKQRRR